MKTTKKRTNIKNKSKINKKVDKNESLLISGLIILFASVFFKDDAGVLETLACDAWKLV